MRAISAALLMVSGSLVPLAGALAGAASKGDEGALGVAVVGLGIVAIGLITWFVMLFVGDKPRL